MPNKDNSEWDKLTKLVWEKYDEDTIPYIMYRLVSVGDKLQSHNEELKADLRTQEYVSKAFDKKIWKLDRKLQSIKTWVYTLMGDIHKAKPNLRMSISGEDWKELLEMLS